MTDHALFDQAGEGPAVMLVHAGIADRRMWRPSLPWLAGEGWHAIAPDLPGFGEHGSSTDPPAPWDFLRDVLDELAVDQAVIVGNSFGGAVALRLAVTSPERVRGLAMISSPAPGMKPSAQLEQAWTAETEAMERGDIDAALDAVLTAWLAADAPAELRDLVAAMQRRAFELDPEGMLPQPSDPLEENPERVREIAVPALVAAGESDMPDFMWSARALADALPHASHHVIAGAGHLAPLEAPDAFRELLAGFLAALDD
ncbi:MAG TPA: alpha/beta hydrolase [Solirubrobacteraceae bacterium]|jgi:pimeloyl-ACP methyl ester carboxylesterase|nr:alpha/beta hydrolase [Solirubrobacteraceae bacterium]